MNIKRINVEMTYRCNSSCIFCPRRWHKLPKKDLDIDKFWSLDFENIPELELLILCGGFGEPTLHPKLFDFIEKAREKRYSLFIHSNGSVHDKNWWKELAKVMNYKPKMKLHGVHFGVDGTTQEIHEKHRKNTKFKKIIKNIKSFTDAGGTASIQTFVFDHNEDIINDLKAIAFYGLNVKWIQLRESRRYNSEAKKYKKIELPVYNRECFPLEKGELATDLDSNIHICCYFYAENMRMKYIDKNIFNLYPTYSSFKEIKKNKITPFVQKYILHKDITPDIEKKIETARMNFCLECTKKCFGSMRINPTTIDNNFLRSVIRMKRKNIWKSIE